MGLFRRSSRGPTQSAPLVAMHDSYLGSLGGAPSSRVSPLTEYSSKGTLICKTPYSLWYWIESIGEVTRYDNDEQGIDRELFMLEGEHNTRIVATQRACRREYDRLRKEARQP